MGPPGGGRNDITSRFTRHLNMISIDEFDDSTLTRIFTNITDWHFGKGFDASFVRSGKVNKNPRDYLLTLGSNYFFLSVSFFRGIVCFVLFWFLVRNYSR